MHKPIQTIANPINLPYHLQVKGKDGGVLREAADPSLVRYHGRYWLFPSKSAGFWHSLDLVKWQFAGTEVLPIMDYAPDVRVIDDWLVYTASSPREAATIYRTRDPLVDDWELLSNPMPYGDPNLFQDDDGRVYLYHGCSDHKPLWGVALDREKMVPIGKQQELIEADPQSRGWERNSENNEENSKTPWLEGLWLTKHKGRYYLQYASPGTTLNVYSDAVFTADHPLGPYTCQAHNPFSFKPGGFITGAGHGSTFQDEYGNWWHISTMRISVRHKFERRLGLWPAGFDEDGILFCNTRFGDWPMRMPEGAWNPWRDPFAGWMLLSRKKSVTVSSERQEHQAKQAVDEDVRTFWAAAENDSDPWLSVDLQHEAEIRALQINFAELECKEPETVPESLCHQYIVEGSNDGTNWETVIDRSDNRNDVPHDYIELATPCRLRYLRLRIRHMTANGAPAVCGFRIFGLRQGAAPQPPGNVEVVRDQGDPCAATVKWTPESDVSGYNVRWGVAPDKLYCDWLVYDSNELTLRCLSAEQNYWFSVEAFNESGVSQATEPYQPVQ